MPVENWGAFSDGGGLKGAVDFLPLDQMVLALRQLVEVQEQTSATYARSPALPISCAGRGWRAPATAERLKGNSRSCGFRSRVSATWRSSAGTYGADYRRDHRQTFQPQTLLLLSDFQQTSGADPQVAMKAIAFAEERPDARVSDRDRGG